MKLLSRLRLALLYCTIVPYLLFFMVTIQRKRISMPGILNSFTTNFNKLATENGLYSAFSMFYAFMLAMDLVISFKAPKILSKNTNTDKLKSSVSEINYFGIAWPKYASGFYIFSTQVKHNVHDSSNLYKSHPSLFKYFQKTRLPISFLIAYHSILEIFVLVWTIGCTQMMVTIGVLVCMASLKLLVWLIRRCSHGFVNWKYSICNLAHSVCFLGFSILMLVIQMDRKYEYIVQDDTARTITNWVKGFYFAMWAELVIFRFAIYGFDFVTTSSIWKNAE
jgi:hypothetical protein